MRSGFATWLRCIRLDAFSKANASEEKALTKQARRLSREDVDGLEQVRMFLLRFTPRATIMTDCLRGEAHEVRVS